MTTTTRTFDQKRTAKDPAAFVQSINDGFTVYGQTGNRAELVTIDGETSTGRKRFTVRFTITTK